MELFTWLTDHALILLLGCGTLFNVYWLHRCRERLHLRWPSVLLLSVLHTVLGVLSVKVFALFETGNFSNMSLFGGVFFMPLFYWGVAKLAKQKTADVFDVFTICLVFTLMCARLNCIISGCCLGAHIPIELRDGDEIKNLRYEKPMALPEVKCFNPSFDVTDHELLTGIVTEKGICYPPFTESLAALFKDKK